MGENRVPSVGKPKHNEVALQMTEARCCLCGDKPAKILARGYDFEYNTSPDEFTAVQCEGCELVYLNPRPHLDEFVRIYPSNYHAFEFSEKEYGLIFNIRRRLEARRLLKWCQDLPEDARILDIGCGDGFHLELLRDFGNKSWYLEGIDADGRAASMARKKGLTIHCGLLSELDLPKESYDLAILIQTVEHVANPFELLNEIRQHLRPGGRLCVVTDNTDSLDFRFFRGRHWGGYHFPRHWNLFNPKNIRLLAKRTGMEVETLTTQVSPVNWVYSIRNRLTDKLAPSWLIEQFSLKSPVSLSAFTLFDALFNLIGRGALLNVMLRRPT
mgnify:CR=1 FL=1